MAIRKTRKIVADPTAFKPASATPPPQPDEMGLAQAPSEPSDAPRVTAVRNLQRDDIIMIFDKEIKVDHIRNVGSGLGFDVQTTEIWHINEDTGEYCLNTRASHQNVILIGGPSFDNPPDERMALSLGMQLNVDGDAGFTLGPGRITSLAENPYSESIEVQWLSLMPYNPQGDYRTARFSVSNKLYRIG